MLKNLEKSYNTDVSNSNLILHVLRFTRMLFGLSPCLFLRNRKIKFRLENIRISSNLEL